MIYSLFSVRSDFIFSLFLLNVCRGLWSAAVDLHVMHLIITFFYIIEATWLNRKISDKTVKKQSKDRNMWHFNPNEGKRDIYVKLGTNKAISLRGAFVCGLTIADLKRVISSDTEPASSGDSQSRTAG